MDERLKQLNEKLNEIFKAIQDLNNERMQVMAELKSIHSEIYKNKKENGTTKRNI